MGGKGCDIYVSYFKRCYQPNAGAAVVFMCVCVYCLPYHIRKPAGRNLSPATLAVFCFVSSFLLHSFLLISLLPSLAPKPLISQTARRWNYRNVVLFESASNYNTTILAPSKYDDRRKTDLKGEIHHFPCGCLVSDDRKYICCSSCIQ